MEKNIALDGDRTVSFKVSGQPVTLTFRRLSNVDWKVFFSHIIVESENVDSGRVDRIDFRSAGLQLVNDALKHADGYKVPDSAGGYASITTLLNWRDRIPYTHKIKAAELLQDVTVDETPRNEEAGGLVLLANIDEVRLEASWNSTTPGTMDVYKPLIHRFSPANVKQQQRYSRASSEAKVVGGSRTGRTIYPVKHQMLAELYDELIVSVEGYEVAGDPLGDKVESIKSYMDTFHKVAAVQQLFSTVVE